MPTPSAQVGCELEVTCVLRLRGRLWLCMINYGGAAATSAFLRSRLPCTTFAWPFAKPAGWQECRDYVWEAANGPAPAHAVLAALEGLPDDTRDAEPLPAELTPCDPPASDPRSDMMAALVAALGGMSGLTISRDVRVVR